MGSHPSKMIRIGLFLSLILVGASAAPQAATNLRQDFTEEDVEAILNMVFCACDEGDRDGVLSLDEFTSEVCEVVNNHLFDYQVNAEDFENLDSNDDGQLSTAEVLEPLMPCSIQKAVATTGIFSQTMHTLRLEFECWAVLVTV